MISRTTAQAYSNFATTALRRHVGLHIPLEATASLRIRQRAPFATTTRFSNGDAFWQRENAQLDDRAVVERATGYAFNDEMYLELALNGSGQIRVSNGSIIHSGQKHLALIGDGLLRVISYSENFPLLRPNTSITHKLYAQICTNANLKNFGEDAGLGRFLSGRAVHYSGTVVEAILGAIYLDSGHLTDAAKHAIDSMLAAQASKPHRLLPEVNISSESKTAPKPAPKPKKQKVRRQKQKTKKTPSKAEPMRGGLTRRTRRKILLSLMPISKMQKSASSGKNRKKDRGIPLSSRPAAMTQPAIPNLPEL